MSKCTEERSASQWYVGIHNACVDDITLKAFESWLEEDPQHRDDYEQCELMMALLDSLADDPAIEPFVEETLIKQTAEVSKLAGFFSIFAFPANKFALGLASLVLATMLLWFVGSWDQPVKSNLYQTGVGQQRSIQLQDGSGVALNTDSVVRVEYNNERRKVVLENGEATFSVVHQKARPFDVLAGGNIVRAIGTRFNVFVNGGEIHISVLEGEVVVVHLESGTKSEILVPGRSAQYKFGGPVRVVDDSSDIVRIEAWLEGKLIFNDWDLDRAITEHNRYADKKMVLDAKNLAEAEISGVFNIGDTQSFTSALQEILPVTVVEQNNIIAIRSRD